VPVREAAGAGRFIWPFPADGVVTISPAQLGHLLDHLY
jgi:transposase